MTERKEPFGRPKKIDVNNPEIIQKIKTCGELGATQDEMAGIFGVTRRTIETYMSEEDGDFFRIYKKNVDDSKLSLRRKRLQMVYDDNSVPMAIFLSKVWLGDKEPQDDEKGSTTNIYLGRDDD